MEKRGSDGWEIGPLYSETQVKAVLHECGIEVENEDGNNFYHFCPFHGNRDTPSFTVSKTKGLYHCYNPACGRSGPLLDLVRSQCGLNHFAAARLISKKKSEHAPSFDDLLAAELEEEPEWNEFDSTLLAHCYDKFWQHPEAQEYMRGRGFAEETLKHFRIGFSVNRNSIVVPMHNPDGLPIGLIGRSLDGKEFKNSKGLPKNQTAWNYHRAKREGDTVIVCEASFDAMRIHQAGYRNVVALLGGNFSRSQHRQLARTFNNIVIMTDFDDKSKHINPKCAKCKRAGSNLCMGHNPGEELGAKIAFQMKGKRVLWAHCGGVTRFPPGVKDACDMTDTQIRYCISNAISNLEYALET